MKKLTKIYRKEYTGEDVNVIGTYRDQEWHYEKEHIANPFNDLPFSNYAVVIGNGMSRVDFDLRLFMSSRQTTSWGERTQWFAPTKTKKQFNTYGCNAFYREYRPDFLVLSGNEMVKEVADSDYCDNNIVYTTAEHLFDYAGKFHYIPQQPDYNAGTMAAYLAAFDGHKRVFMLGFDGIDNPTDTYNIYAGSPGYPPANTNQSEEYWVTSMYHVMSVYDKTEFIRVAPTSSFRTPEAWKYLLNFRTISFRQFVLEADL